MKKARKKNFLIVYCAVCSALLDSMIVAFYFLIRISITIV